MKTIILICFLGVTGPCIQAQGLVGKWQLMKQSHCMDDAVDMEDSDVNELVSDMKGRADGTPQVVQFKENNTGEESTRILSRKKTYNTKSFLYKFSGTSLYILDKRSRTIIEGYNVEKFDGDSLIISNAERACETKVFIRIK